MRPRRGSSEVHDMLHTVTKYAVVMVKLMISLTGLIFHSDTSSRFGMKCYVELFTSR